MALLLTLTLVTTTTSPATGSRALGTASPPIPASAIPERPGVFGEGWVLLPNGRILTPAGRQTLLGPVPINSALSPNQRDLLVTADGRGAYQDLQVVSTQSLKVVQQIRYLRPSGLFDGIVYAGAGRVVYASGGSQDVIHVFSVAADGRLMTQPDISLVGPGNWNPFPAGIALVESGTLLAVAENASDRLAIVNPSTGRVAGAVSTGSEPYAVVGASSSSSTAYVTNWASASVSVIHIPQSCLSHSCRPTVLKTIHVRAHPSALALHGSYLYVANSNSDSVSVISTATNRVAATFAVGLLGADHLGSSPEGLALSPDGTSLYVADSGDNALAVVELKNGLPASIEGWIPTGEYPTSVIVDKSGRLFVTDMLAYGPGPNNRHPSSNSGLLTTVSRPTPSSLASMTSLVSEDDNPSRFAPPRPTGSPVPTTHGSSPIKHVIYVVKENQSYDQVFGDLKGADGDPSLVRWGAKITPNLHALAQRFGIFDNFYADGAASADGHNWAFSANDDDFNEKMWWQRYSHRLEFGLDPGASPMDLSPGGYIWDRADQAGITYRDYGEFYPRPNRDRWLMPSDLGWSCPGPVARTYLGIAIPPGDILCLPPSPAQPTSYDLAGHHDARYRGLDMRYSDIDRVLEWRREFNRFVRDNDLPTLEVMWLPNDHTAGGSGFLTPASYVAQNDRAVGMLVDAVSHSKYWGSTAIFITQDDAEGSRDHVNARRTECLVVSPYTQTAHTDVHSGLFDFASMLRTIELILHLKPMSKFDASAQPMYQAFNPTPDLSPFEALPLAVPPSQQ